MSFARIIQLALALILIIISFKKKSLDTLSIFLVFSIIIQTIATIKYEQANELVAYNFTAILIMISAITFRGKLKLWLQVYFPIHVLALLVPLFYKSHTLYSSINVFISNFLFGIFSIAIALAVVLIYTAQEFFNNRLQKELLDQEVRIKNEYDKIQKLQVKIALGSIAAQVAHDIRSPLAALNMITESITSLPIAERKLMTNALQRINEIANDLLTKGKQKNPVVETVLTLEHIPELVEAIVEEKRMQYNDFRNLKIDLEMINAIEDFAKVNANELKRVISNLVNNSVESLENQTGRIVIGVQAINNIVEIFIQDNGKGIPANILSKIGVEGFSHGKELKDQSGSGLGLYHAKLIIENFSGVLLIESEENVGTIIRIQLPKSLVVTVPDEISLIKSDKIKYDIVLLDNDPLVCMTWEMKAKRNNKSILILTTEKLLHEQLNTIDPSSTFYIDVHLTNSDSDQGDGVQISKDLFDKGYLNLYLATGYDADKFSHVTWIKGVVGKAPVV